MIVRMKLLSDAIFGSGESVPGAEDISVLCDRNGFPYYKGGTFKGIFREELERLLKLRGEKPDDIQKKISSLLGEAGDDEKSDGRMYFSDFCISQDTRNKVTAEIHRPYEVTAITTNIRTFTAVDNQGVVRKGSLRMARCADKGLSFYSHVDCPESEKELVEEALGMIKWVGSMRNRGFGKVKIDVIPEADSETKRGSVYPAPEQKTGKGSVNSAPEQKTKNAAVDPVQKTVKESVNSNTELETVRDLKQTKYIRYEIQNVQPLRIADDSTSQRGQTSTLRYIPGTTIRGYVINRLAKDPEFDFEGNKRLLFSEHVRFMDCSLKRDGAELWPPLKGFYEDKSQALNGEKKIENVTIKGNVKEGNKRASLGNACRIDDDKICFYHVETGSDMKIHIKLRDRSDKQNVFRSEYILPGCVFAGYIAIDEPAFAVKDAIISATGDKNDYMTLGNARTSGMGKCRIIDLTEQRPEDSSRAASLPKEPVSQEIYMILLSNTVMRDHYGKYCGLNLPELEQKLGVSDLRISQCSTSVVDVRGYNSHLHLKTPSVTMYERGSVFHLSFDGSIDPDALKLIACQGIGIRRNEGFGQVTFVEKKQYEKIIKKKEAREDYSFISDGTDIENDEETLRIVAGNYLRRKIRRYYQSCIANGSANGFAGKASETQKSMVRALLFANKYDFRAARDTVRDYFKHAVQKQDDQNIHQERADISSLARFVNGTLNKKIRDTINEIMNASPATAGTGDSMKIMDFPAAELITDEEFGRMKINYILDLFEYDNRKKA